MAKKEKTLDTLFHETLKDIYFAEKKILAALPKMAKAAQSRELRAAFEKHEAETEDQVGRLEQVFELIGETPKGKTCDAINGIVKEGQGIIKDFKGTEALDAGLLAAAQSVEHYEISRYGTLKAWAEQLGLQKAVQLLDTTLQEEKETDEVLSRLAESAVNREAAE
jgi:ferritin-like metal-binding protein YciE